MAKKVVALFTDDIRYMKAFASYVERHESERFCVKTFNDANGLKEYVQHNRTDIVLVGDECPNEFEGFSDAGLFVLSEEKCHFAGGDSGRCLQAVCRHVRLELPRKREGIP